MYIYIYVYICIYIYKNMTVHIYVYIYIDITLLLFFSLSLSRSVALSLFFSCLSLSLARPLARLYIYIYVIMCVYIDVRLQTWACKRRSLQERLTLLIMGYRWRKIRNVLESWKCTDGFRIWHQRAFLHKKITDQYTLLYIFESSLSAPSLFVGFWEGSGQRLLPWYICVGICCSPWINLMMINRNIQSASDHRIERESMVEWVERAGWNSGDWMYSKRLILLAQKRKKTRFE